MNYVQVLVNHSHFLKASTDDLKKELVKRFITIDKIYVQIVRQVIYALSRVKSYYVNLCWTPFYTLIVLYHYKYHQYQVHTAAHVDKNKFRCKRYKLYLPKRIIHFQVNMITSVQKIIFAYRSSILYNNKREYFWGGEIDPPVCYFNYDALYL